MVLPIKDSAGVTRGSWREKGPACSSSAERWLHFSKLHLTSFKRTWLGLILGLLLLSVPCLASLPQPECLSVQISSGCEEKHVSVSNCGSRAAAVSQSRTTRVQNLELQVLCAQTETSVPWRREGGSSRLRWYLSTNAIANAQRVAGISIK